VACTGRLAGSLQDAAASGVGESAVDASIAESGSLPIVCTYADEATCADSCVSGYYAWPDGAVAFVCAYPSNADSVPCPPPTMFAFIDGSVILLGEGGPPCVAPNMCEPDEPGMSVALCAAAGCPWVCLTLVDAGPGE